MKSLGRVGALVALVWFVGALITVAHRSPLSCGPLISEACGARFLNWLGDVTTFAWVREWEALVGALIALLAALLGAHVIRQQMAQTETIDRASTARKLEASRAVFPITLSSGIEHLRQCSAALRKLRQALDDEDVTAADAFASPELPSNFIQEIKSMIEFEQRGRPRALLVKLVHEMQIMHAGMRHLEDRNPARPHPVPFEVEDVCAKVCVVHGIIDLLFPYSRGSDDFTFDEAGAVWNAASILWYRDDPDFEWTQKGLELRYGPDPST